MRRYPQCDLLDNLENWERALAKHRNPNIYASISLPEKIWSSTGVVESRRRSQRCQSAPTSSKENHSKYYYRTGDSQIVIVLHETE